MCWVKSEHLISYFNLRHWTWISDKTSKIFLTHHIWSLRTDDISEKPVNGRYKYTSMLTCCTRLICWGVAFLQRLLRVLIHLISPNISTSIILNGVSSLRPESVAISASWVRTVSLLSKSTITRPSTLAIYNVHTKCNGHDMPLLSISFVFVILTSLTFRAVRRSFKSWIQDFKS